MFALSFLLLVSFSKLTLSFLSHSSKGSAPGRVCASRRGRSNKSCLGHRGHCRRAPQDGPLCIDPPSTRLPRPCPSAFCFCSSCQPPLVLSCATSSIEAEARTIQTPTTFGSLLQTLLALTSASNSSRRFLPPKLLSVRDSLPLRPAQYETSFAATGERQQGQGDPARKLACL